LTTKNYGLTNIIDAYRKMIRFVEIADGVTAAAAADL
jgi:hypothetical protein